MLVAKRQNELICTLHYSKEELRQMRRQAVFHCPCCDARVILKAGVKTIAHFAHERSSCVETFSERESMKHLQGKAQLYAFLQRFFQEVTLEPYLPTLQQRPDVLAANYAVEFQCSPLAADKMLARTEGYKKAHYEPLWIPYARFCDKGWRIVSFSQMEQQLFQWSGGLPFLMAYSPERHAFIYYSSIMQLSATKFYTHVEHVAADTQQFPFLQPQPITKEAFMKNCHVLMQYRNRALLHRLRFSEKGVQDDVLQRAYERYGSILSLPAHIGIFVPHAYSWPISPIDWQLYYVLWHEQAKEPHVNEAAFFAFCGIATATTAQKEALRTYAAIVDESSDVHNAALFSSMYDKIVAFHVQN